MIYRYGKVVTILAGAALLAGCGTVQDSMHALNPWGNESRAEQADNTANISRISPNARRGDCPHISVLPELSELHQYQNMDNPTESGHVSSVSIIGLDSRCAVNDMNMIVDLDIIFHAATGPQAANDSGRASFSYPYFMAITDENNAILTKEIFAASIKFDHGWVEATHEESLRQLIPMQEAGREYRIMVGFQLNEEELAYNRAHMPPDAPLIESGQAISPYQVPVEVTIAE